MNATRLAMLRHIAAKPRTMKEMCAFKMGPWAQLSETTVRLYVFALASSGHVKNSGNRYAATEKGLALLAGEAAVLPGCICNASIRDTYAGPKWESARPGADQHRQYLSRGV